VKSFSILGLCLALCLFAAPVHADVCDEPIVVTVQLSDMFDPATQDALANGGTLRYDVLVSGTGAAAVGTMSRVTLDFVFQVVTLRGLSTFTRPRAQVNVNSTERAVRTNRPLLVGSGTTEVCLFVFAHPAGGQCGGRDVRGAQEVGSGEACINMIIE
jgi:hypothetical protein